MQASWTCLLISIFKYKLIQFIVKLSSLDLIYIIHIYVSLFLVHFIFYLPRHLLTHQYFVYSQSLFIAFTFYVYFSFMFVSIIL